MTFIDTYYKIVIDKDDHMDSLLKLLKYLKKYWKWALLAPLFVILEVVMDLTLPNIMSNIVNIGIGNRDFSYIMWNVILMLVLTFVGVVGGLLSAYYASKASQSAASDLRHVIFEKVSKLSFFQLGEMKTGHFITVLTNDISLIGRIFMMCMRMLFRVPVIMIGSLFMALSISLKLSSILIIIIPILLIVVVIIMRKSYPYFNLTQESIDEVNTTVRENLGGIRVVKAFVTEGYEMERFDKVNEYARNIMIKGVRIISLAMPVMMLFVNLATIAVLWIGGYEVTYGTMQLGDIMAFIQYLTNILTSLLMGSMVIVMFSRSEVSATRICEVLALENDFQNVENPLALEKMEGRVEFQNVSFSYTEGSGDAVLRNINFTAEPGETIAILGATGSGKSTLVNLIPRFYEVSSGQILIDGINVNHYRLDYLRKHIGIAFQQTFIFSDTIFNNIAYGKSDATLDEVKRVAQIAQASSFIEAKKEGYDYWLEQRGTNLSGGQKQRIAIARTLLPNPSILILDDSTSAVDMKTEREIRRGLRKEFGKHTTFIVAGRISSAMDADKIIVLEDGEMVGMGTHKELMKNCSIYQDIYYSQMEKKGGK